MFDGPDDFNQILKAGGIYVIAGILVALMYGEIKLDLPGFVCLSAYLAPVAIILTSYKLLEISRRRKPPKDTVQKLNLDE